MVERSDTPDQEPEGWRDVAREAAHFLWWFESPMFYAGLAVVAVIAIIVWVT